MIDYDDTLCSEDGKTWHKALPTPYPFTFIEWLWHRATGWRDHYGRKAHWGFW